MLKNVVFAVLVAFGLLATFVVLWLTANYTTMEMLKGLGADALSLVAAVIVAVVFFALPFVAGSLAKSRLVNWVDQKFEPSVPFAWWHHILIGIILALPIGAFYPYLSMIAAQNPKIIWALQISAPIRDSALAPVFTLLAANGWFWFGAGAFLATYVVTKYKK